MLFLPPPSRSWLRGLALAALLPAFAAHAAPDAESRSPSPDRDAADRAYDAGRFADARRLYLADCHARKDGKSCSRYGLLLITGQGGPVNDVQARRYAAMGCEGGYGRGCANIGLLIQQGRGGPVDMRQAEAYYTRSCDLDWGNGCYLLASLFWSDPATQDDVRSRPIFDRACRLGMFDACYNVGEITHWGYGGPIDLVRAREAYALACDRGEEERWRSCSHLAVMLEEGKGGAVDLPGARRRYGMACDNGYLFACNNLGVMERIGSGGPRDTVAALARVEKACAAGDAKNCETSRLFRRLDQEARVAAQAVDTRTDEEFRNDPRMWQESSQRRSGRRASSGSGQGVSWARQQQQARTPKSNTCRWKTYEGYGGGRVCVQE
ncbi:MAG TPA: tetratricopeptide repeat protein [Arenimonas sp.]